MATIRYYDNGFPHRSDAHRWRIDQIERARARKEGIRKLAPVPQRIVIIRKNASEWQILFAFFMGVVLAYAVLALVAGFL